MRIAFFGSPEFVVPILSHLHETCGVRLIVSQPDKPVGRKQTLTPTPVKQYGHEKNILVETPKNLKGFTLESVDIAIVAAYGLIIPKEVLDQPKFGFINVHYSLLPKYRGASPVQSALIAGEKITGTTIMKMDTELDHGEIIEQQEVVIDENDTSESLLSKLNEASIPLLSKILTYIQETGKFPPLVEQDHSLATFTQRLTKEDGFIEFETVKKALTPHTDYGILHTVHNKIRGLFPWPGAWTILPNGKRLKLISSRIVRHPERVKTTEGSRSDGILRSAQNDQLELFEIQLEGKQKTSDTSFLREFLQ